MIIFLGNKSNYRFFEDYINSIEYYLKQYNIQYNIVLEDKFINFEFNDNNYYFFIQNTLDLLPNNNIIKKSFIINTEQLSKDDELNKIKGYINQEYKIIDYSLGNIKLINNANSIYIPYLVNPNETKNLQKINEITMMEPNSDKRKDYFNYVKSLNSIPINTVSGWKDERDNNLFKYKILLNIHHADNYNIFESMRCDRCVFNKMIVLSEKSLDVSIPDDIKQFIVEFKNKDELGNIINSINTNFDNYYNNIFKNFNLESIKNNRLEYLIKFLKSIQLLNGGKLRKNRKTKKKSKRKLKLKRTYK